MSKRSLSLDVSALSPQEWSAYEEFITSLQEQKRTWTGYELFNVIGPACTNLPRDRQKENEVLAFFKATEQLDIGHVIAVLRLLDHQRTVKSLLCYDHAFIQSGAPLSLSVKRTHHTRTISAGSNPFRKEDVATTPTAQTSFDTPARNNGPVSTNPFRALSQQGGRLSPIDTRNISPNPGATSPKLTSPDGPPLPKRRVQPPPKRIVSEFQQPTPKHSRNASRTVTSEPSSIHSGRGPALAPKPKLVSSTYIGPSTNLRPRPPGAIKANAYSEAQDSDTFSLTPTFTSESTSSVSSTGEDLRTNRPIAELANQNTGSTDFSIRSLKRSNTTGAGTRRAPPPPPKRKDSNNGQSNGYAAHTRSNSMATPRPEWMTRAKEQIVARIGDKNERASLMRDDREDEYRAASAGGRDERSWTPL